MNVSNDDLVAIAISVRKIIKETEEAERKAEELAEAEDLKRHNSRKREIAELREKAGLKQLTNDSMASAMAYRDYTDRCERKGVEPVGYQEFWGYTDSKDYIEPSIRARLKELGGLRG